MADAQIDRLIQACAQDMEALEQLYRLLKRDIFAFAYSILRDVPLAEDCVQETFVRLPEAAARLRKQGSGKAFVFSIARYAAMELLRKRGAAAGEPQSEETPDGDGDFTRSVEAAALLGILDGQERQILVLHVYSGWTFREIAALLDRPVSTVKSCYARARILIQKEWRKAYDTV